MIIKRDILRCSTEIADFIPDIILDFIFLYSTFYLSYPDKTLRLLLFNMFKSEHSFQTFPIKSTLVPAFQHQQ